MDVGLLQHFSPPEPTSWGLLAYGVGLVLLLWVVRRRAYGRSVSRRVEEIGASDAGGAKGTVYVLTNPEYPELVKVGFTSREATERAAELSASTGVPTPFTVAYEATVDGARQVEGRVHEVLGDRMVNPDREFFKVSVPTAVRAIRQVASGESGWMFGSPKRSALRTGLGMGVFALALAWTLAVFTGAGAGGEGATVAGLRAEVGGLLEEGATFGRVGRFLEAVAVLVGPGLLGYSGALMSGMVGLWGEALVRHRLLSPLYVPTGLSVIGAVGMAGTFGWVGHRPDAAPLWTARPETDRFRAWSGEGGRMLSERLKQALSPDEALLLLGAVAVSGVVVAGWWGWTRPAGAAE